MSKLGVGVGEEFPVDEEKKCEETAAAPGEDADPCRCGPGSHFGGTRAERREAMRRWRHQMRSEWRARRRAMHEQFHRKFAGEMHHHDARHVVGKLAVAGLALIGLAALFHYHHDH
jgi:hypothetical protein